MTLVEAGLRTVLAEPLLAKGRARPDLLQAGLTPLRSPARRRILVSPVPSIEARSRIPRSLAA
ncbi:hypothetical protein [Amycolatopsis dendrobii]|uniref:Uncharacterized protein n=1 Tax=Amycolatopsis dendrobii TaxID=2760662 RepID=A0A7W3W0U3_9PSEU|nr:hypothetical protein [Amycolatopsis dendrobii]MBB1156691.1 hypothetical protein [Amycolatopsis dendrobii]